MNLRWTSVKKIFLLTWGGMAVSMLVIAGVLFAMTGERWVLISGMLLTLCALSWMFLLTVVFSKRLSIFTRELCREMDRMISGSGEPLRAADSETLFARISYRLSRMYGIMQENRRKVDEERQELQMLVSDVSHQVKTPVSNLKMVTDTLLSKPVTEEERREFLQGIQNQTDKLEFLFQALVKTSRLEIGAIRLEKKDALLIDTLAMALSGIVYAAEKKGISVTVDCPDDLHLSHDSKWTAEALFNLLDNAVKYTPAGGAIRVSVEQWEMYVKLDVSDTGKGILESNQAAIFRRFYREEEVHGEQGIGIGLYLTREIVTKQGGYIKVLSEVGRGSTFSVFLPWRYFI
ncbi:MAG: HAMP domain-containing histidine kinase [Lachnospiraceae bacterium]|nr:HAMP domain-containing histidine kinase [Lachnospiraceae bacterium]